MKDIARDLGISVVAVSKVLRNQHDIGVETRRRVLERAKALNYRPNFAARALITGRSYTIALVVPGLLHPFFAELARALSKTIRKQGYGLIISSSEEDADLEAREIDLLIARGVDALIIATCQSDVASFRQIEANGTPYVLIDRKMAGLNANFVGIDDELAGYLGTAHLLERGYTRVAHIGGLRSSPAEDRLAGYRRALKEHKIKYRAEYVAKCESSDELGNKTGYEAMMKLLSLPNLPDAVFCFNDPTAAGAMNAILDSGLRIPEQFGVVGCGNTHFADYLRVPLTSIDQNTAAIGETAGNMAMLLIEKQKPNQDAVVNVPTLVVRQSTQRVL
jgi:LacI family transcriptional regulator